MNYKVINTFVAACSLSLFFAGCSTKKEVVTFDNDAIKGPVKEKKIIADLPSDSKSIRIVPSDEIITSTTNQDEPKSEMVENSYNTTSSIINGEEILLKSIHFDFDAFTLTEENLAFSAENSKKINDISQKDNTFKIKLEGNCDEWGSDEYNYALGLKRSMAVKTDLIKRGIAEDKIVIVSYGEGNPICKEQTAECWTKNRRVDHYLIP